MNAIVILGLILFILMLIFGGKTGTRFIFNAIFKLYHFIHYCTRHRFWRAYLCRYFHFLYYCLDG